MTRENGGRMGCGAAGCVAEKRRGAPIAARRLVAVALAACLCLGMAPAAQAVRAADVPAAQTAGIVTPAWVQTALEQTAAYLVQAVPEPTYGQTGGDWVALGLARAGAEAPEGYFDGYLARAGEFVAGQKGNLSRTKTTEYARLVLAVTALGGDVTNFGGYDLLAPLRDSGRVLKQGVNGAIYALLALDCHGYGAAVDGAGGSGAPDAPDALRQAYLDALLAREVVTQQGVRGGFALSGNTPDPDVTAMALQALTPYAGTPEVASAITRALGALSRMQGTDGGFASWGAVASESVSQAVAALCALGIDPRTDARFIKNGNTLLDALRSFAQAGGGFAHTRGGGVDQMATEQAMLALAAYARLQRGQSALFAMDGVELKVEAGHTLRLKLGSKTAYVDGKPVALDAPVSTVGGRTMLPARFVAETLGASVLWEEETRTATFAKGGRVFAMTLGSKTAYLDGKPYALDVAAYTVNGRTMAPVRFIGEALGAQVSWDETTRTATVITKAAGQ